jgi:hypothetical protein
VRAARDALPCVHETRETIGKDAGTEETMMKQLSLALLAALTLSVHAADGPPDRAVERLGKDLTPMGAERAGNADGSIPAWDGGYSIPRPESGTERHLDSYELFASDEPIAVITADNMAEYADLLTVGQKALLKRYPETYKMPLYETRRSGRAPEFIYEANRRNAERAYLSNGGESINDAVTGIPFPLPDSGKEAIWNHKLRYRGESVQRYNVQLAVQSSGRFTPFKLREDIRFHYNNDGVEVEELDNVGIYFLQLVVGPPRQAGNVLLVHETLDQVKESRRAWQYNAGQRRVRRAPDVSYDNPGTGSDGLRTNDQLDMFNGATDRYTWKLVGKKEVILPYNSYEFGDSRNTYEEMTRAGHINQDLTRYEKRRVWVVESELKAGISHLYKRRTFYIDEDTWSILGVDIYDRRDELWRYQELHSIQLVWLDSVATVGSTVYDLQANRYLLQEISNEEPLVNTSVTFGERHFTPSNISRMATR